MDRGELEGLDRESLVVRAQAAGIRRARILTRPELIDELLRLDPEADEGQLRRSRGFFGRARDLVARVVERGLHLPDAAERIRTITGDAPHVPPRVEPQAMPTVTLAEIYAAQGHARRAIETLERVLDREPDHVAARALLARLRDDGYVAPAPPLPPEPEIEPPLFSEAEADTDVATPAVGTAGPAADDDGGAEFFLLPEDPEPVVEAEGDAFDEDAFAEEGRAPTRELPAGMPPGGGETFAIIAAEDKDVDALAITGVVAVLPESEDPDECFAIPLLADAVHANGPGESRKLFVRWRVSFTAIGAQLGQRPQGRLVVRAHVIEPSWDGPRASTRDQAVDADAEDVVLEGLPAGSVVRVAIGWLDGDTFVPLAHSPALEHSPHAAGRPAGLAVWTPRGLVPVALDDPRSAGVLAALEAARRVAGVQG